MVPDSIVSTLRRKTYYSSCLEKGTQDIARWPRNHLTCLDCTPAALSFSMKPTLPSTAHKLLTPITALPPMRFFCFSHHIPLQTCGLNSATKLSSNYTAVSSEPPFNPLKGEFWVHFPNGTQLAHLSEEIVFWYWKWKSVSHNEHKTVYKHL